MTNSLGNSISRVGLVGEWLLDGNALDTSGNGNNGTATNVTYVKTNRGYQAQAGSFGGSSYITASSNGNLNGDFTISGRFNALTQTAPAGDILNFGIDNFSIYLRQHNTSGGYTLLHPTIQWNTSQYTEYNLPSRMNLGWTFFTMTVNRTTNKFQYSQNGVFQNELTIDGIGTFNNSMNIGQGAVNNYRFKGQIQGVRIYNRVLSQEEIQLLYLEGQKLLGPTHIAKYPKLFEGLVGYWDFRGTAHNLVDGVTGTVNGATLTQDRFGNAASAYSFDGINNSILLGNNFGYTGNSDWSVTLELYINSGIVSGNKVLYSTTNSSTSNSFEVYYNNTTFYAGKVKSAIQDAPSIPYSSIPKDQWFTLTLVYNSSNSTSYIYKNGSLLTSGVRSGNGSGGTFNTTILGCGSNQTLFSKNKTGLLLIQNKALSADEVKLLYALTSQDYIYPSPSYDLPNLRDGLVLDLNEQGKDLSGNGNNGTLVNSPVVIRQGKAKGLSYNGSNQALNVIMNIPDDITINIPVIPTNNPSSGTYTKLFSIDNGTTGDPSPYLDFSYDHASSQYLNASSMQNTTSNSTCIAKLPVSMIGGQFSMITVTFNSSTNILKVYKDGIFQIQSTFTGTRLTKNRISFASFYDTGNSQYMNGKIFNPKVWNRVLSDKEIQALYYSQKANFCY